VAFPTYLPRSDELTVAVDFSPRTGCTHGNSRRGATHEVRRGKRFSRRYATWRLRGRIVCGLKSTATIEASLREERSFVIHLPSVCNQTHTSSHSQSTAILAILTETENRLLFDVRFIPCSI